MGFWWLALKDALIIGRDRKALLTLILMPILLIGILGAAFGNMMDDEDAPSIKKFKVGIVNGDDGELGSALENEVFKKGMPDLVSAESMAEEELERKLKNQEISVGVIIPENFSGHIMTDEKSEVKVVSIPSAAIQSSIVENAVLQFSQTAAVNVIGLQAVGAANKGNEVPALAEIAADSSAVIEEIAVRKDHKPVGSFQYYAAGMGVMFLLMTVITGVSAMIEEKEQDVYNRLLVTTLSNQHYLLGKFIGLLFMSSVQFLVIIVTTRYLYGVNWGESMIAVLVVGFSFVFSACGLGVLLGAIVKTEKTFNVAGMLGTQIMAAVGGSMVPLYMFPDWMNSFVKILPNALALQTFLELMSGGNLSDIIFESAILLAIGVGSLIMAVAAFSARRRAIHA